MNFAQAHFRNLQSLYNSFPEDDLDLIVSLTQEARSDLSWWLTEADFPSGKAILISRPDLRLAWDASRTGWGAVCLDIRTGGPWTRSELLLHINGLELLAALKSLECFTASVRDCSVEIQIDNKAVVSYINRLGGCKSKDLCKIALQIASWCEKKNISLNAIFIPGKLNTLADRESRRPLSSGDWKFAPSLFRSIYLIWEVRVDLFASDWIKQLPQFVSWLPQPGAWKVDAFNLNWKELGGYCFPPFNLIPFCLSKLLEEEAEVTIITPYWPSQPWFPSAMDLTIDFPHLLLPCPDLLTSPTGESHPLVLSNSIRLIAWRLSGVASKRKAFQTKLSTSSYQPLVKIHELPTSRHGTLVEIGVLRNTKIPCRLAYPTY